ncbi:MAG TPA: hypothetical protein DCS85_01435 [Verrucomicrobiales bacterium]|jgi:hypothetical protein|nr:glycosyltransferase family 39 protein [Roseibacillus sp.]HAT18794.1 hypothetical protein [Verrucomicrobiales bacterium]
MSTADNPVSVNAGIIIRRVLFFILLIGLSLLYLLVTFRGLDSPKGMDQAQIAREIARNEGFTTKVLRPVSIWQNGEVRDGQPIIKDANRDTYHAPLHPILLSWALKFVGGDDADKWRMTENDTVYKLDRVVAATSVICFLIAIGVNYLLISRIFDARIGGVTALLMLLCDLNWKFSQTGLPQMFMLLLFSCACFFAYRAVEATEEGRTALGPALIAATFLGLLALTHWLAIWIVLGFAVYAGFFLRPRGAAGLAALGFVLLLSLLPLIKNKQFSGSMGGTSILAVFNGLGTSEDSVMRTYNLQDAYLPLQNLPFKIVRTTILQAGDLYINLGSLLTAPLFFLSLLHPFKRRSIANFRWCLLLMWLFGAIGMAIFGLKAGSATDPNQLHVLFAPLFAAYGLAFVAILWSRLKFHTEIPPLRNAHFVVAILISAGPMILDLPRQIREVGKAGTVPPHWPPYYPAALNTGLAAQVRENEIVVTDQPWAVAWYADRSALWLPNRVDDFKDLENLADSQDTPFAGLMISPYSHSSKVLPGVYNEYEEWSPLILDGWASVSTRSAPGTLANRDPELRALLSRYPNPVRFVDSLLIFWSVSPTTDTP